jgi:hypothetical protein
VNAEEVSWGNPEHGEDEHVEREESWDVLGVQYSSEDQCQIVYGHLGPFLVHNEALEELESEVDRVGEEEERDADDFRIGADERDMEGWSG